MYDNISISIRFRIGGNEATIDVASGTYDEMKQIVGDGVLREIINEAKDAFIDAANKTSATESDGLEDSFNNWFGNSTKEFVDRHVPGATLGPNAVNYKEGKSGGPAGDEKVVSGEDTEDPYIQVFATMANHIKSMREFYSRGADFLENLEKICQLTVDKQQGVPGGDCPTDGGGE